MEKITLEQFEKGDGDCDGSWDYLVVANESDYLSLFFSSDGTCYRFGGGCLRDDIPLEKKYFAKRTYNQITSEVYRLESNKNNLDVVKMYLALAS